MSVQAMGWVMDHSPTTGTDRLVLLSIANHAGANPVDGAWEAWPGTSLLMREAGLKRANTLSEALARLVERGHLERLVNAAPDSRMRPDRRTNLYRILLGNGVPCSGGACSWCGVPDRDERGPASRVNGVPLPASTGSRIPGTKPSVEPSLSRTATKTPPTPPTTDLAPTGPASPEFGVIPAFEAFYAAYPRHEGKVAAAKAWPKAVAVAGGDTQRIISGAMRYRTDPNREDAYTAHPATWLNAGRWDDDPLPSRNDPGSAVAKSDQRTIMAMEWARQQEGGG